MPLSDEMLFLFFTQSRNYCDCNTKTDISIFVVSVFVGESSLGIPAHIERSYFEINPLYIKKQTSISVRQPA